MARAGKATEWKRSNAALTGGRRSGFFWAVSRAAMICDGCDQSVDRIHDIEIRTVRDLPILDATTWLSVPRRRVLCPCCGPKLERLDWLDRHARVTRRLAKSVVRLYRVLPVKQVAAASRPSPWT